MKDIKRLLIGIVTFILLNLLFIINFYPPLQLSIDEISPKDIRASHAASYTDEISTRIEKEIAAREVEKTYKYDISVNYEVENLVKNIFYRIKIINQTITDKINRINNLKKEVDVKLKEETYNYIAELQPTSCELLKSVSLRIVKKIMQDKIREDTDDIIHAKRRVKVEIRKLEFKDEYKYILEDIITSCIQPNSFYDEVATKQRKEQAMRKVKPIILPIKTGEIIIHQGERINQTHIVKLKALQDSKYKTSLVGIFIINLLIVIIISIYLFLFKNDIFYNHRLLFLLSIIVISSLLLAKIINNPNLSVGYHVILPFLTGLMLIAILLDLHLSLIINPLFSIYLFIIMDYDVKFAILGLISGMVAILSVTKITKRSDIARAGGLIALFNFIIIIAIALLENVTPRYMIISGIVGVATGFGASILTIGGLFFLEKPFGISTAIDLLELSSPNEPLLKRLMNEAPGTYTHSVYVANLAAAAAEVIGADSILTRVGGYFHDIGKIKRPYFYIENQLNVENAHKNLSPQLSASIIKAHIQDGVELAQDYRLPPIIIDFIKEHHGTSLIYYFYQKGKEKENPIEVENFRYDGPKPQTKESALVMLADGVEAATRALEDKSSENIKEVVKKIINERLQDGQLNESNLVFKDIDKIVSSFTQLLEGMYHTRVKYEESNTDKELPQENKNK